MWVLVGGCFRSRRTFHFTLSYPPPPTHTPPHPFHLHTLHPTPPHPTPPCRELTTRHLLNYAPAIFLRQLLKRKWECLILSATMDLVRSIRTLEPRGLWLHFSRQYNPVVRIMTALGAFVETDPSLAITSPVPVASPYLMLRDLREDVMGSGGGGYRGGMRGGMGVGGDEDDDFFGDDQDEGRGGGGGGGMEVTPVGPMVPAGSRASASTPVLLPQRSHQPSSSTSTVFDFEP